MKVIALIVMVLVFGLVVSSMAYALGPTTWEEVTEFYKTDREQNTVYVEWSDV